MINKIINYGFSVINRYMENSDIINDYVLNLFVCVLCLT